MDRWFKTEQGQIIDIVDHCLQEIGKRDNLKIYIGTDSQNSSNKSNYATAIVFRYGLNGCHYVYKKVQVPRIRDHFVRLFKEAELTIGIAELITKEIPIKIEALEFDYNTKKTKSTPVISAATGWAQALGYKTRVKPDEMIASKAADYIVRKY